MPDSSTTNQPEHEDKPPSNLITALSQFADDNLTVVRKISTGLAIAGVIVIARSVKLLTKFGCASDIPSRFIERNVSLRGRVRTISAKGLEIDHVPIHVPLLSPLLTSRQPVTPLEVHLAGVELTPTGQEWLEQQLRPAQTVWLRLVQRQERSLFCLVLVDKRAWFSTCLNEELLRLGLARSVPIPGLDPHCRAHWRLQRRLLRAEVWAERKGKGIWKEESLWTRMVQSLRSYAVVRTLRDLLRWTSRRKEQ